MTQMAINVEMISLNQALNEIHFYKSIVPIKAYEFLAKNQQEVTPILIQTLKNVIQRHDRTGDYYVAHIHALLLLSQFREKKAYPVVLELLKLPVDSIDRLLGGLFTHTIPQIILSIYDGNPEPLFALLLNHDADNTLRLIIGICFSSLIYQKMISTEVVLLRLQEVIASGKMNEDQVFFAVLANITMECKLEPLYGTIRAAFKAGMVCRDLQNIEDFEQNIHLPIKQIAHENYLNPLIDAAKELAQWYTCDKAIIPKIERNATCPCGSGHKFKKCCIDRL